MIFQGLHVRRDRCQPAGRTEAATVHVAGTGAAKQQAAGTPEPAQVSMEGFSGKAWTSFMHFDCYTVKSAYRACL